jgi:hypothetical protein
MRTYTDPRIFDLAGAVEQLPPRGPPAVQTQAATGTDDPPTTATSSDGESVPSERTFLRTFSGAPSGDNKAATCAMASDGKANVTPDTAIRCNRR